MRNLQSHCASIVDNDSSTMNIWLDAIQNTRNPAKFVYEVSRPHWLSALAACASVVIASVLYAFIPYVFKLIVDGATLVTSGGSYSALIWAAAAYVGVTTVASVIWRLSGYSGAAWSTGARATARDALASYVTLHSRSYFSNHFAGSLANKISHAGNGARSMINQFLWQFLLLGVTLITSFAIAYNTHPIIAYIFIAWVVVILPFNFMLAKKRVPLSVQAQKVETKLNGATVDLLSNASAMQEYARREFEMSRLKELTLMRRALGLKNWWFGETTLLVNGLLQAAFAGALVFLAIYFASIGRLSAGDIILVITVIFNMEEKLMFVGSQINEFSETWGEIKESLHEIFEPHEIVDAPNAPALSVSRGEIRFENVHFEYDENPIFTNLSLTLKAGERVGLVGKSGAGKSTLVRLMLRHHDTQKGAIYIDDQNIASVTQESLRAAISVVPQEPVLFHRSIHENIAYGHLDASREDVVRAAKLAHAHEFISKLPEGYESLVGERGVKLSGGERQRIVIARAILKNAPILILDEATSALDSESEIMIQDALHGLMQGKTVIAIAHRLSTLREMDRIIVLSAGSIEEDGTHDELSKRTGTYAELWTHQAGGFISDS